MDGKERKAVGHPIPSGSGLSSCLFRGFQLTGMSASIPAFNGLTGSFSGEWENAEGSKLLHVWQKQERRGGQLLPSPLIDPGPGHSPGGSSG
jgi:hypothetical protein